MVYIIAHRGASVEAPENTIPAISQAISSGVDFVEFDIRLSRNGTPIVFHDATLSRIVDPVRKLYIADLPASYIATLDAGKSFSAAYCGCKIPTLLEILHLDRGPVGLMIEIKEELAEPKVIAKAVIDALEVEKPFKPRGPIIVGSFSKEILEQLQKFAPSISLIGILEYPTKIQDFLKLGVKRLAMDYSKITPNIVANLLDRGVELWAYTVDDPSKARLLTQWGVEGIITNNPRLIQKSMPLI